MSRNSELWLGLVAAHVIVGAQKTVYLTSVECSQYFLKIKYFQRLE